MMNMTAPLVLSSVQQQWLAELQIPAPFLASLNPKKEASHLVASPIAEPTKEPESMLSIRAALQEALGDQVVLRTQSSTEPSASPELEPPTQAITQSLESIPLQQLQQYADQCQNCELAATRQQAVVGTGQQVAPQWMVISTSPSSHEELAALPMQGKSGELFWSQMQTIGIHSLEQIYLTQLIKCRADKATQAEHIAACQAILWRQIELIQPQRLLLLGSKAAQLFLPSDQPFDTLRGQVHSWSNSKGVQLPTVVSYHPSSLLLRPQLKALVWNDLLLMQQQMHAAVH